MAFGDLKVQDLIYEDSSNNEITVVIADLATKANPVFSGTVTVPTATAGDNSTKAASTAFVVASFAPKNAPAFTGTATGVNLTLSGNLTVSGTQTIINTTTLQVEDKNIEIGKVSSPSDTTADGGGWTLLGSTNKTFNWLNATDSWTSSEHIEIASGKNLKVDGTTFFVDGANNRVGIKTTSPTEVLDLGQGSQLNLKVGSRGFIGSGYSTNATILGHSVKADTTNTVAGQMMVTETNSGGGAPSAIRQESGIIQFHTASSGTANAVFNSERMRIDSSGHVLIGATSWSYPKKLNIESTTGDLLSLSSGGTTSGAADTGPNIEFKAHNGSALVGMAELNVLKENATSGNNASYMQFKTRPAGGSTTERFRLASSGQIGIGGANYGTSGQVLTSGGSGAAPSWAAVPAGGNTFTAVANGAIANNKAVKLDSDGKVSQLATSIQVRSNPSGQSDVMPDGNTSRHLHCCNCGTDMILMLWYDDITNRTEMAVAHSATATGGYSIGTQYTTFGTYEYWFKDMVYIGNNKVVLFIRRAATTSTAYVVTINPSTKAITVGTGTDVSSGADQWIACSWDPDNSQLLFGWRAQDGVTGQKRGKMRQATVSGTTITLVGSMVYFPRISNTDEVKNMQMVYDTNRNRHVVAFIYSGRSKYGTWFSVDSSGASPSPGTATDFLSESIADGWQEQFGMDFDSSTNRIVIACQKQSESALRLVNGQCAANGDMSVNGTYTTGPSVGTSSQQGIHLVFDPLVGKSFLFFLNSSDYSQCVFLTTSSSSNAISQSSIVTMRNSASNEVRGWSAIFDNGLGTALCLVRRQNHGITNYRSITGIRVNGTDVVANLTDASQYVGYADQAYSDGQTATIKTYGNTVDTLSGMTTGSLYYLQQDGTVGTNSGFTSFATNTPLAGTALSATKLLIRDPLAKT